VPKSDLNVFVAESAMRNVVSGMWMCNADQTCSWPATWSPSGSTVTWICNRWSAGRAQPRRPESSVFILELRWTQNST